MIQRCNSLYCLQKTRSDALLTLCAPLVVLFDDSRQCGLIGFRSFIIFTLRFLETFRTQRAESVRRIEALEASDFDKSALHPRLEVPMRLVDSLTFFAEHDDYHLARISDLIRLFDPRAR